MWRALGHLAMWAGLYVAASVTMLAQLTGMPLFWPSVFFAWSTAVFAYLLDRVKVRDRWLDPADRAAHPSRYGYLLRRSRVIRTVMVAIGALSATTGAFVHPLAPLAIVAAAAGVLVYAGLPRGRRPRVKDRFVLKNVFVSAGITGFALLLVLLEDRSLTEEPTRLLEFPGPLLLALGAGHLALRIYADSVLCDIDDESSDRAHDTNTLPTRFGADRAWRIAMWIRLTLAASLLLWPVGAWEPRWAWAVVTGVSTVGLRLWRPRRVRDLVDARFAIEAILVWAVLMLV